MSEAFTLTEDQKLFRKEWRRLFEDKFTERAAEIDRTAEFPWDNYEVLKASGLTGINIPEEYGGAGADAVTHSLLIEELARVCASTSLIPAVNKLGTLPILFAGSEEQKQRFLPLIADGTAMISYCLTEPGSGSDAAAMASRAVRDGDDYVINGTKRFITGGGVSKLYVYYAVTDPSAGSRGISAFVLEGTMPGLEIGKHEDKLGIRGSPTTEVICNDVQVPAANRLGEEGTGFKLALRALEHSRITIGAQALGIAQGALDYALGYVKEREQFGSRIADFQGIQFMLADMAMQVEAARALIYTAAAKADRGDTDLLFFSAASKCFASDVAMQVTTDAVQLLGGYGYVREYPVERMMRDAKITQIYEGTNQVLRVVMGRHLRDKRD
ncbi:MAG TPA: acyl-CoA dehydrogenase family protein [Actinomycetes bacterium]|jgi:alkylation response protein AidB-like acyl-CoA dehydrogenase|nr:acyl-CoA dehydrogenase family protein [Actinomycetes bacterium]